MSGRREYVAAAGTHEADASPILVWNGLVKKMRRAGAKRRRAMLAWTPTVHSSGDDELPPATGAPLPPR